MSDKNYANEHPKYKKKKKSKSYSEAELLEWNREVKEKIADWDKGNIISKMPILTGKVKNTIFTGKKINPEKRFKILKSIKQGTYSTDI